RHVRELAYEDLITNELPNHEYFGDMVRDKLIYYPTVTREPFRNEGRLTDLMTSGKLFDDIGLPQFDLEQDRFMLCGSPSMLKDCCEILDAKGFMEARHGDQGHYVIERAFVEK
ncbi:MAG: ferredoxin--NADP reductase, partial [Pseudomonas neustonica]